MYQHLTIIGPILAKECQLGFGFCFSLGRCVAHVVVLTYYPMAFVCADVLASDMCVLMYYPPVHVCANVLYPACVFTDVLIQGM